MIRLDDPFVRLPNDKRMIIVRSFQIVTPEDVRITGVLLSTADDYHNGDDRWQWGTFGVNGKWDIRPYRVKCLSSTLDDIFGTFYGV